MPRVHLAEFLQQPQPQQALHQLDPLRLVELRARYRASQQTFCARHPSSNQYIESHAPIRSHRAFPSCQPCNCATNFHQAHYPTPVTTLKLKDPRPIGTPQPLHPNLNPPPLLVVGYVPTLRLRVVGCQRQTMQVSMVVISNQCKMSCTNLYQFGD